MNERPKYNPQIHHRRSIRLQGYDYSKAGLYFITICCRNRACLFGKILNGEMILNDSGLHAELCWKSIPEHFPNAILHENVIMPNHIHGIIELTQLNKTNVGVENFQPLPTPKNQFQKMIPKSIGSIIKGFKIGVTKWFRQNMPYDFPPKETVWQRNYYEHIIRNEQSYHTISEYIINNPTKW